MFAKAVELDPQYARAYAGIADCDSFLLLHYHVENIAIEDIVATSAKALALEDGLAEAHASRGLALSLGKRYDEAKAEFERAIALDPNSFEAHYFYARACFTQGKLERAATLFEQVAEIKPDDYQSLILLIQVYRSLGRDADRKVPHKEELNGQRVTSPFILKIRGPLTAAAVGLRRPWRQGSGEGMVLQSVGD